MCMRLSQIMREQSLEEHHDLLAQAVRLRLVNSRGDRALHWVTRSGDLELACFVLAQGGDVHARNVAGHSVVHEAAKAGQTELLRLYIKAGGAIDLPNRQGDRPIHLAASAGHTAAVELLLDAGCSIESRGACDHRALHAAAGGNHVDTLRLLLARGADIHALNKFNKSALQYALWSCAAEAACFLLEKGAQPWETDYFAYPPYYENYLKSLCLLDLVLRHGASVDVRGMESSTPLGAAICEGDVDGVRQLVEGGCDLAAAAFCQRPPLELAIECRRGEIARYLISTGRAPLTAAVMLAAAFWGDIALIRELMAAGGDVHALGDQCWSLLHAAARRGDEQMFLFLREQGVACSAEMHAGLLHAAICGGAENWGMLRFLVAQGVDINARRRGEGTLLIDAPPWVSVAQLREMIAWGADIHVVDEYGAGALHHEARLGDLARVRFFVELGCDFRAKACYMGSPIDIARLRKRWDVVAYLESLL